MSRSPVKKCFDIKSSQIVFAIKFRSSIFSITKSSKKAIKHAESPGRADKIIKTGSGCDEVLQATEVNFFSVVIFLMGCSEITSEPGGEEGSQRFQLFVQKSFFCN